MERVSLVGALLLLLECPFFVKVYYKESFCEHDVFQTYFSPIIEKKRET